MTHPVLPTPTFEPEIAQIKEEPVYDEWDSDFNESFPPFIHGLKGTVTHKSATRIQRMIATKKLKLEVAKREKKYQDWERIDIVEDEVESIDSSQQFAKEQLEKFDSERDLFSEHSEGYYKDMDYEFRRMNQKRFRRNSTFLGT